MKKAYAYLLLAVLVIVPVTAIYLGLQPRPVVQEIAKPPRSPGAGAVVTPVVQPNRKRVQPDTPEFEKLRADRMKKLDEFNAAAYDIVKKTQDKEGIEAWDFMVLNGRPAVAVGEMDTIADTRPADKQFLLAVINADDAIFGEPWAQAWAQRNEIVAVYLPGEKLNMVVLSETTLSGFAKGLFYLHELRHARSHNTTVVPDTVEGAVSEELAAYAMQDRLARKMAGEPFERMLKEEIDNVVALLKNVPSRDFPDRAATLRYRYSLSDMPQAFPGLCKPGDEKFCFSMFNRLTVHGAVDRLYPLDEATSIKRGIVVILVRISNKLAP